MKKTITKIKEYKEGAKIYYCHKCKHNFTIPRNQKAVRCFYCGNTLTEGEGYYYVIS